MSFLPLRKPPTGKRRQGLKDRESLLPNIGKTRGGRKYSPKPADAAKLPSLFQKSTRAIPTKVVVITRKNTAPPRMEGARSKYKEPATKFLTPLEFTSLIADTLESKKPLSDDDGKSVKRFLEQHHSKSFNNGLVKLRKKSPLGQELNLPCSLFVRSESDGEVTDVYLSHNNRIQGGTDKVTEKLIDISSSEEKILLKARRFIYSFNNKKPNPHFESATKNLNYELGFMNELDGLPGIAAASEKDFVLWKRGAEESYQTAFIAGNYLGDLRDNSELARKDPFKTSLQLLQGLSAIHEKYIVHGDLKPGNALIKKNGGVGICDFGRSIIYDNRTESTVKPGTYVYSSPESLTESPHDTRKSDVFSMGCILHFILNGEKHPWADSAYRAGKMMRGGYYDREDAKAEFENMMGLLSDYSEFNIHGSAKDIMKRKERELAPLKLQKTQIKKSLFELKSRPSSVNTKKEIRSYTKALSQIEKEMQAIHKEFKEVKMRSKMTEVIMQMVQPEADSRPSAQEAYNKILAVAKSSAYAKVMDYTEMS